jgi:2-polyprenyl-3-methyl-5-hydroxy-6-metoxy-1,4-benzoquinol methylase
MLDVKGTADYWKVQTEKGDNPCHYHNYWQDKYAFSVRTGAFKKADFAGANQVVDIGCGIGEYTKEIARLTDAHFTGFDFPFNIEIAKKMHVGDTQLEFRDEPLPSESIKAAIAVADVVITTTVYVHLAPEARSSFIEYASVMKPGSKVMLLEYMPDEIPPFQKGLAYKDVETVSQITERFEKASFKRSEVRHVNFVDSFLFFHIGKNAVSYAATVALDTLLRLVGYTRSKYKLVIFTRI